MKQTKKYIVLLITCMMLSIQVLSLQSSVMAAIEEQYNQKSQMTQEIPMEERVTRAELNVDEDTQNLSTIMENKNVEMKVVLDTSSAKYALYKNPYFEIEMPSSVQKVTLKDVKLVLEDELKMKEAKVTSKNGKQVIQITLQGEQTKYFNSNLQNGLSKNVIAKGANIVIKANIIVKQLTPSKTEKAVLYYTNEKINRYEKTSTEMEQKNPLKVALQSVGVVAEEKGVATADFTIVAPSGVTAATTITMNEEETELLNLTNETKQFIIPSNQAKKRITITGTVFNSDEENMSKISILGRIPSKETTKVDSSDSLGSTFDLALLSDIKVEGIDSDKVSIYYSENGAATNDLNNLQNAWKKEDIAFEKVKSYYIVLEENQELAKAKQVQFSYLAEVPARVAYDQKAIHTYKAYYQTKVQEATILASKTAGNVEITTGQGPKLTAKLEPMATSFREGQIVKMKVEVENKGVVTAENVTVKVPLPEYTSFVKYSQGSGFYEQKEQNKMIAIGNIEANNTKTVEYYLKIKEHIDGSMLSTVEHTSEEENENHTQLEEAAKYPKTIKTKVEITFQNGKDAISSNECEMNAQKGKIALSLYTDSLESKVLQKGEKVNYTLKISNISGEGDLKNVVVSIPLEKGLKFIEAGVKDSFAVQEESTKEVQYHEDTNSITVNFDTLSTYKIILVKAEIGDTQSKVSTMATCKAEGIEEHYSNTMEYKVEKPSIQISELIAEPKYVKEGETITYHFKITNDGNTVVKKLQIQNEIPSEVIFTKATYTYGENDETTSDVRNGKMTIVINQLAPGETTEVKVMVKAALLSDKKDKQVQNKMTVSASGIESKQTNTVTNIIEYHQVTHDKLISGGKDVTEQTNQAKPTSSTNPSTPTTPTNPSNPTTPEITETYKISGTAWIDKNKNGKREESEELLGNLKVMLIYKANNEIVKDKNTKEEKIATTNEKGEYQFENLEPNEYLVIFLYDAAKYNITDYQKEGVDESTNSDAINLKITLDGKQIYAGVANTIKLTDRNQRDIDIGLYLAEKFDLRLDKYIDKITLTTPTIGTRVTTYQNSKLEKPEILARNVGKSSIIVEYKIIVTNEGQVPGYATKIVDYLPEDMKFNTELNRDWYASDNNHTVYNTSLAEIKLNPGESKELTLVLSLNITEKNMGKIIRNQAEIYESYNEQGLEDFDSKPANKIESEDDLSGADILISVVTGKIVTYTVIALVVISLLIVGIVIIKRKVLTRESY